MTLRCWVPMPLQAGPTIALPAAAARHVQVRRLQPGDGLVLFNGDGLDWQGEILAITRSGVDVRLDAARPVGRELALAVTLAVVVPANERMDTVVEKATELGVAALQPLLSERSVWRLAGERAARRVEHWQAVAIAAAEQCGRARVPRVAPVRALADWLTARDPAADGPCWLLDAPPTDAAGPVPAGTEAPAGKPAAPTALAAQVGTSALAARVWESALTALSGPEGGFTPQERALALDRGCLPVRLGPRVLRADTAPLALLAWLAISLEGLPGR